jgi:putative transposase
MARSPALVVPSNCSSTLLSKRNKQRDCLHKASHLIAHRLAERAMVIGDLSQRRMVIPKQEHETPKERNKRHIRNRMVYNEWGRAT